MNKIFFWLAIFGLAMIVWKFAQIAKRKNAHRGNSSHANSSHANSNHANSNRANSNRANSAEPAQDRARPAAGQLPPSEAMLRCAHCGVYMPQSDAYQRGQLTFCSVEHRDLPRA